MNNYLRLLQLETGKLLVPVCHVIIYKFLDMIGMSPNSVVNPNVPFLRWVVLCEGLVDEVIDERSPL